MKKAIFLLGLLVIMNGIALAADKKSNLDRKQIYDLTERCGKSAKDFYEQKGFDQILAGKSSYHEYQNHYNVRLNKCFILITGFNIVSDKDKPDTHKTLWRYIYDVHENVELGEMLTFDDNIDTCIMLGAKCNSEAAWFSLIKPYMQE